MRHIKETLSDIPENGTEKIQYRGLGLDLFYDQNVSENTVISTILYVKRKWGGRGHYTCGGL